MPKTERQIPPSKRLLVPESPSLPNGSLLSAATPVAQLREQCIKLCIYGRNRSGKTTLACKLPGPLLLISTEPDARGGAGSVTDMKDVYLQRVSHRLLGQDSNGNWLDADDPSCTRKDTLKGSDKLSAILGELQQTKLFKTVVLDTATSLQELMLVEIMNWHEPPVMHPNARMVGKENYQYRAEKWRKSMIPLLDLQHVNVVVLCQEKDHNAPTDDFGGKAKLLGTMQSGSFMAPALGSTNAQWLQDNCGYIFQLYEDEVMEEITIPQQGTDNNNKPLPPITQLIPTGKRQRHLRLQYHPNFAAGSRTPFSRNTPQFVTASTPAGLYAEMLKYIPSLKG